MIDDNTNDGTTQTAAIVAYDTDITEIWRYPEDMSGGAWNPFTLADLDGDGRQEIVVREHYARAAAVRIPVSDAIGGLRASVAPGAAILECDEIDNTADWTDLPCP